MFLHQGGHFVGRDRETDVGNLRTNIDSTRHADDFAAIVHQGTAAVAGVDAGIDLDHPPGFAVDEARHAALGDLDARAQNVGQRKAHDPHRLRKFNSRRIAQRQHGQIAGGDADERHVPLAVNVDDAGRVFPVAEFDFDFVGIIDNVGAGDDVAVVMHHEPGARALLFSLVIFLGQPCKRGVAGDDFIAAQAVNLAELVSDFRLDGRAVGELLPGFPAVFQGVRGARDGILMARGGRGGDNSIRPRPHCRSRIAAGDGSSIRSVGSKIGSERLHGIGRIAVVDGRVFFGGAGDLIGPARGGGFVFAGADKEDHAQDQSQHADGPANQTDPQPGRAAFGLRAPFARPFGPRGLRPPASGAFSSGARRGFEVIHVAVSPRGTSRSRPDGTRRTAERDFFAATRAFNPIPVGQSGGKPNPRLTSRA